MAMRTFDEIAEDLHRATSVTDVKAMRMLATEMEALGTLKAQALSWRALGNAARLTSDYALALEHYRHALSAYEELEDRAGVASVIGNMGAVYSSTGDYPTALEHHRRALAMYEELGNRGNQARIISNIGSELCIIGDYMLALKYFSQALAIHEELGNRIGMAIVISNMGLVSCRTGDYPSASEYYHRAQALIEESDHIAGVGLVIQRIADLHHITGDYPTALAHYHRALALYQEHGNRSGVANVTGNIGSLHSITGDYTSALKHFQNALDLHEDLGNSASAAIDTGNVVDVLFKLDRFDEAAALLEKQASMQMNDPRVVVQHLFHFAALAEHRNDLEVAEGQLLKALATCTETGLRAESAETHGRLRDLAQKRNDFAGYIEHNKEYQRITEEIRGKEATQRMAMMEAERKAEAVERERDKERALLYGALPKAVADRMIRGEKITGDHFEYAAVLFIDVAAFTTHTAAMHPGDVVLLLEDLFSRMDSICDQHGVVKVKTIGDSYMCFRGDADAHTNAVCMMHVALDVMSQSFTWPDGSPLIVRMGAHVGPATAGVIGTQRLQYDVWGDTVNVASRMESHGEPGRIHVSEAFAHALSQGRLSQGQPVQGQPSQSNDIVIPNEVRNEKPGTWNLELRGETELKGKGTMTTYWLEHAL